MCFLLGDPVQGLLFCGLLVSVAIEKLCRGVDPFNGTVELTRTLALVNGTSSLCVGRVARS